jgi:hypothetical protein
MTRERNKKMANRLYVEAVTMDYYRRPAPETRLLHGFMVYDDYESHEFFGFPNLSDVPDTLEKVIRHCLGEEHGMAFDLIVQHSIEDKGLVLDGHYVETEELQRILNLLSREMETNPEHSG